MNVLLKSLQIQLMVIIFCPEILLIINQAIHMLTKII